MEELTPEEFARFLAVIYRVAGIKIPTTKRVMVGNRLRRRLRATGIDKFADYYAHLTCPAGAAEVPKFIDEMTTNETYFFRDKQHFDWLDATFFPEIARAGLARKRPKTLRVWSAAASTGEELYSIALKLAPKRPTFSGWKIDLVGTDISGAALTAARAGAYDERAVRLVGPDDRKRYFDHDPKADRWVVKGEVRADVSWRLHNLMTPLKQAPFDCVFIKNVLIYFDVRSKKTVVRHLVDALARGGYLVVGPTEGIYNMLEPLEKLSTWLYRRPFE